MAGVRIAASRMAWKPTESEKIITTIKWAQWLRVARNHQLRIGTIVNAKKKFDGFKREVWRKN